MQGDGQCWESSVDGAEEGKPLGLQGVGWGGGGPRQSCFKSPFSLTILYSHTVLWDND